MKSKIGWIILGIVALLLVFYLGGSFFFSNVLMTTETQTLAASRERIENAGVQVSALPAPEAVTVELEDTFLSGSFYENPENGECAVLLLHGYTSTRFGTLQYAPLFWERGCDLLAYDARGHGESGDAFHTYGYYEKSDGQLMLEWLRDRTDLPPSRIGLAGVSYGAATVLQMLPLTPDVAFVLADSPYQSLEAIVTHQSTERFGNWVKLFVPGAFFISEMRADFDKDDVSAEAAIAAAQVPVLLIHSQTDEFTPASHSEAIYANSNPETTELYINEWGSPHARDIFTDYDAYSQIVGQFLAEYAPDFGVNSGR